MEKSDFIPFLRLNYIPLGMTAHILYTALDKDRPATLSPTVIRFVRDTLKFDGLLMSDDLSMKALKGDFAKLTQDSLAAGCDIVLHCNGKMEEMRAIASACRPLDNEGQRRLMNAWSKFKKPEEFQPEQALAQVQEYLELQSVV